MDFESAFASSTPSYQPKQPRTQPSYVTPTPAPPNTKQEYVVRTTPPAVVPSPRVVSTLPEVPLTLNVSGLTGTSLPTSTSGIPDQEQIVKAVIATENSLRNAAALVERLQKNYSELVEQDNDASNEFAQLAIDVASIKARLNSATLDVETAKQAFTLHLVPLFGRQNLSQGTADKFKVLIRKAKDDYDSSSSKINSDVLVNSGLVEKLSSNVTSIQFAAKLQTPTYVALVDQSRNVQIAIAAKDIPSELALNVDRNADNTYVWIPVDNVDAANILDVPYWGLLISNNSA